MSDIPVRCLRSSCISESVCGLEYLEYDDSNPLVLKAIHAALSVDERQSQEDMTVIGLIGENDESMDNNIEALSIPDSSLQVIPHCKIGASWYYGVLDGLHTRDTNYLVSCRTNVMIQSASLPILSLATGGRMTPQRLWRLAMLRGRSEGTDDYVLDGIDYGEVESVLDVTIRLMSEIGEVHLSDVELIKKAVIHQGRFWMWVRPDRFPLQHGSADPLAMPILLEPPSPPREFSKVEGLPFELISQIVLYLPIPSVLSLLSASRQLRSKVLRFAPDRDTLARAWIITNAPWYLPTEESSRHIGWTYLRRCVESGSMRNRKKIWCIAQQLEQMADDMGI